MDLDFEIMERKKYVFRSTREYHLFMTVSMSEEEVARFKKSGHWEKPFYYMMGRVGQARMDEDRYLSLSQLITKPEEFNKRHYIDDFDTYSDAKNLEIKLAATFKEVKEALDSYGDMDGSTGYSF